MLGILGMAALKNLREEGFQVTCFESTDRIGGVWQFSKDLNRTTGLLRGLSVYATEKSADTC